MSSHIDSVILGLLGSAFFTLIWRKFDDIDKRFDGVDKRFDGIDKRLLVIEGDLRQFYSITGELKGRLDTLEKRH